VTYSTFDGQSSIKATISLPVRCKVCYGTGDCDTSNLHAMDENELEDKLPVYFEPPLWAQRIGWVLEQIRRYSIRTVSISTAYWRLSLSEWNG